MLCIKTKIQKSKIHGIGLFADEDIAKGTLVWQFEPKIDLMLSQVEVDFLSEDSKKQFLNYAFFDKGTGKYVLCGDDARFFNHSSNNNCDDSQPNVTVAMYDIKKGEELTVDYRTFYGNLEEHLHLNDVEADTFFAS